jgi:hypothetical protein
MIENDSLAIREMGCTEAEFARWLPGATQHAPIQSAVQADLTIHRITVGSGMVEIRLQSQPPRRIGGIALPVLLATFHFTGMDTAERCAFMTHFDNYTRRGGG